MNNVSLGFLNNNEVLSDDDVDELFTRILHVNPPATIVDNIMKAIAILPPLKPLSKWDGFDFLADDDFDQSV